MEELENDKLDENNELKIWKDDDWVKQWCSSEPKLSKVDLKPYFYFTRTSLDERFDLGAKKLSPKAKEILRKLLNKTDISIKYAVKEATEINDHEAGEILEEIFTKMIEGTSIDKSLFKAFINWGLTKEVLITDVISNLESINGKMISISIIPLLKPLLNKSTGNASTSEILERWKKENADLSRAIDNIIRGE